MKSAPSVVIFSMRSVFWESTYNHTPLCNNLSHPQPHDISTSQSPTSSPGGSWWVRVLDLLRMVMMSRSGLSFAAFKWMRQKCAPISHIRLSGSRDDDIGECIIEFRLTQFFERHNKRKVSASLDAFFDLLEHTINFTENILSLNLNVFRVFRFGRTVLDPVTGGVVVRGRSRGGVPWL
ncbi:hypothetical protein A2U01_0015007, partial [Trifolium medium]|nr:hypothetical protein [Trifolium medium]